MLPCGTPQTNVLWKCGDFISSSAVSSSFYHSASVFMDAKSVHSCRLHLLCGGILGLFRMLGNTFWTEQDTALHCIWWSFRQRMPAFSPAPTAPLLTMFALSHYGMCTVGQRTVRVVACREGCPVLLLLSVMAVRSIGVMSCSGAIRAVICGLCTDICCTWALTNSPYSHSCPTNAESILVFFFHGGY